MAFSVIVAVPTPAAGATAKVAETELPFEVTLLIVIPAHVVDNDTPQRFSPVMVTVDVEPLAWLAGSTEFTNGGDWIVTSLLTDCQVEAGLAVFLMAV